MAIQVRVIDGMGSVTETSPGVFATTGMMTADHMGVANDFVGRAGVLKMSTDFIVAQRLAGANMSVDVSVGTAYVLNSSWSANSNTHTKYWSVINDATVNAVIGANASGNPRIDIVTLKVDTAATPDGNASNVGSIYVTAGTPAASPVAPATPSNHLLLAYVAVANGAVSIVTANITDKRVSVYLDTNPTASGLADLGMSRQAVMNGNFDIWQRGTTVTNPADNTFIADRYKIRIGGAGYTPPTNTIHSRQSLTPGDIPNSFYFYRVNPDGAGSGATDTPYGFINEHIEHGTRNLCGAGKTVTVSLYARSSISNKKLGVSLLQDYGTGGSPTTAEQVVGDAVTLTSSWVKYTFTITTNTLVGKTFGTNNNDHLELRIWYVWGTNYDDYVGESSYQGFVGSGNIDIAQVQLCAGDVALPFQPKSYGQELVDCQRYFETSYSYGVTVPTGSSTGYAQQYALATTANGGRYGTVPFKVSKRPGAVVVTIYPYTTPANTGRVSDSGGTDLAANSGGQTSQNEWGFSTYNNSGGNITTGGAILFHWAASAEL